MARTTPFPFAEHLPTSPDMVPGLDAFTTAVRSLVDDYLLALGDADRAGDLEDACFYEGQVDALQEALTLLLDVPQDAWDAYRGR